MELTGTHYTASYTAADFDIDAFLFEASEWAEDENTTEGVAYLSENKIPAYLVYASGDVRPAPKANITSVLAFVRRTFEVSESHTVTGFKDRPVAAASAVHAITAH